MKKIIIVVFVLVAIATAAFGQNSSISVSELYKQRDKEIREAEKWTKERVSQLKRSAMRRTTPDPAEIAKIMNEGDSLREQIRKDYWIEIQEVLRATAPTTPTTPATTVVKKTTSYVDYDTTGRPDIVASASSETPVNLPPPVPPAPENKRAARGANLIFQGSNGGYSGRSSMPAAADAYNSSRLNEAIAIAIEASAQPATQASSGGQTTAPTTSVPAPQTPHGYVGYIQNNAAQYVIVTIVGIDNPYFSETRTVKAGQTAIAYLPAGRYRFITKLPFDKPTVAGEKFVGNPMSRSILDGIMYWWSVTQHPR